MLSGRKPEEETPDDHRWIPAQKFGGEEEMAGAILYLASRAARCGVFYQRHDASQRWWAGVNHPSDVLSNMQHLRLAGRQDISLRVLGGGGGGGERKAKGCW